MAEERAQQAGRRQLLQLLESRYDALLRQLVAELGDTDDPVVEQFRGTSKAAAAEFAQSARIREQSIGSSSAIHRAYVWMEVPLGESLVRLLQGMNAPASTADRFRATQTYRTVADEVKRIESTGR